jgi:2,3-dihydroxybiphenyl 1,2-dioxygenase
MSAPLGDILGLAYLGANTRALADWERFGVGLLGLEASRLSRSELSFRMDGAARRLMVREGSEDGVAFIGWAVRDAVALDALALRLEAAGRPVARLSASVLDERGASAGIATTDPCGFRIEFILGQVQAAAPFKPGRPISGFRTGPLGMGHAVLNVERIDDALPFYRDVLGFHLSDYTLRPFKAYFFHLNARHHSLALIESPRAGLHHLMMEVNGIDDMGQGYDLAQLEPGRVATTLGRHTNDHMVSFYMRSPSGFMIEYGWGGRDIDPATWQAVEMNYGPSLWGHERDFLPETQRAEARRMRLKAAADGERAPLKIARE